MDVREVAHALSPLEWLWLSGNVLGFLALALLLYVA